MYVEMKLFQLANSCYLPLLPSLSAVNSHDAVQTLPSLSRPFVQPPLYAAC